MASGVPEDFCFETRDAPPAHLLINALSVSRVDKYESEEYVLGDYKWKLIIYPHGRAFDRGSSYMNAFLCVTNNDSLPAGWCVTADCIILVQDQYSNKYYCFRANARRFDSLHLEWEVRISKNKLPTDGFLFLVGDKCVFGAEIHPRESSAIQQLSFHEWKISDFSKLNGEVTNPDAFIVGGLRWKIRLFPKGHLTEQDKSVSIFMECVDSKSFSLEEMVKADFFIRIRNQLSHAHFHRFWSSLFVFGGNSSFGFLNLIPISKMCDPSEGFVVDDCCFLDIQIQVRHGRYTPRHIPLIR